MDQPLWESFIKHSEDTLKTSKPIVVSGLKNADVVSFSDTSIELGCRNQGERMYLERNKSVIEEEFFTFSKKRMGFVFSVPIQEKKQTPLAPLLAYDQQQKNVFLKAGLHPHYTFDNFAVSGSNHVAFAAAESVAESPGQSYNPLFLYGGVGVGKTHIAQAVAHRILQRKPDAVVRFSPGDQFTNELIESIGNRTTVQFRKKYRPCQILILDDIQFIAGKKSIQEEFFHTFNAIVSAGGQVILTSDRPPHEIKDLEDRLRSRFSGGLMVDVQPPDFELRTAILLIKAKEKNITLDIELAKLISEQVQDTRALEGTLLSIYARSVPRTGGVIDYDAVASYFDRQVEQTVKRVRPDDVIKCVCAHYRLKTAQIKGPTRVENIAFARQVAMYLLRKELQLNLQEIARILKRKDHTTIMHGAEKIEQLVMTNPRIKEEVDRIRQTLQLSV